MKDWWTSLQDRERWLFGTGAMLALSLSFYAVVWSPFLQDLHQLRRGVAEQRAELVWMRAATREIKRLEGSANDSQLPRHEDAGRSLLTLVDQTARAAGLDQAMRRVEPQGSEKVTVHLEQASFDSLARWLVQLTRDHAIETVNALVDRQAASGFVNARITLQSPPR
jgi:general secretion pathway protein M